MLTTLDFGDIYDPYDGFVLKKRYFSIKNVFQKLNCDLNAPAIDCGCHPTAIASQFITGGSGKAECLARGKKGSKGSTWKLTCDGQPTKAGFQIYSLIAKSLALIESSILIG